MSWIYDSLKNAQSQRKYARVKAMPSTSETKDDQAFTDVNDAADIPNLTDESLLDITVKNENGISGKTSNVTQDEHSLFEKLLSNEIDVHTVEAQIIQTLNNEKIISDLDVPKLQRMHEDKNEVPLITLIHRLGIASDHDIARAYSEELKLSTLSIDQLPKENIAMDLLSERFLKEHKVLPLEIDDDFITVAMSNPLDVETCHAIELASDRIVQVKIGIASEIDSGIDLICEEKSSQMDQILDDVIVEDISDEEVDHLKDLASEAPVIRLVNLLIQRAVEQHASDIHIEPFEGQLKVRYRVDGVLKEVESPAKQFAAAIISRIKIMANLDISERRLPQDGRVRTRIQGFELDLRVSTVPTMHGESVVLRLLNQKNILLDFDGLGFSSSVKSDLKKVLSMPHGMTLITGPTGSGKTTTLYTALNELNTPNRKIITVEDPIEYQLEGINQIQAKPSIGLTFANALRSIVRQDPDVIMLGEMRDLETAEICVKSALTGHLVLSTLHTNDAVSSITRLIEMRVEDYLLTSTLNAILAQRLVRKLCNHCKQPIEAPNNYIDECHRHNIHPSENSKIYMAVGCESCGGTGYIGRTSIVELLLVNDEIKKKILAKADANELKSIAINSGMRTMYQDGLIKVSQGLTSIEEIVRIIKE